MTKRMTRILLGWMLPAGVLAGSKEDAAGLTSPIFGDHMVLQRQIEVPVWGTTAPGGSVTVKFVNQTKTAKAGSNGEWQVKLDRMEAVDAPQDLTVTGGEETRVFSDVLVGAVEMKCNNELTHRWF